jgi:23S rRNA pseudouridine2605 synthase
MRLNKYLALSTGLSRRAADDAVADGRVLVNGVVPDAGQQVGESDAITLDGTPVTATAEHVTILLHKPAGYVCSRNGQGSKTVYELLPDDMHHLKPVGRLDKDSSGLLLMTTDGDLANQLTHPRYQKSKQYEVKLDKPLQPLHKQMIEEYGVMLDDGPSRFSVSRLKDDDDTAWLVTMREGRNRQIRRTFGALGYEVKRLHRTEFGTYRLGGLKPGTFEKAGREVN